MIQLKMVVAMVIKEVNFDTVSFVFFPSFAHLLTYIPKLLFSSSLLGNFNVAEHVQEENCGGDKITTGMVAAGFVLMILVQGLLF